MKSKLFWPLAYIGTILLVNIGFSYIPPVDLGFGMFAPMAIVVGATFIVRDFAQRAIGHYVLVAMLVGLVLSYLMADPYVAFASAAAFIVSETVDYIVFTVARNSTMRQRIAISNGFAIPLDSVVFLLGVGIFTLPTFFIMIASKALATLVIWFVMAPKPHDEVDDSEIGVIFRTVRK